MLGFSEATFERSEQQSQFIQVPTFNALHVQESREFTATVDEFTTSPCLILTYTASLAWSTTWPSWATFNETSRTITRTIPLN